MKNNRIEKIDDLLEEYYENLDDPYGVTELSMDLVQNHMGWLLEYVKKNNEKKMVYVLHIQDVDNVIDYYYTFSTREEAWDFAIKDAEAYTGKIPDKTLDSYEEFSFFQICNDYSLNYRIIETTLDKEVESY